MVLISKKEVSMNNTAIVLQGPVDYVEEMIGSYGHIKENVVISTNKISKEKEKTLKDSGFRLVNASRPKHAGYYNFNNQVATTFAGISTALELGFTHCLKLRSDIIIKDIELFIDKLDKTSIYFSARHTHRGRTYLCEHMLFGSSDFMKKLWSIPESASSDPPEIQLTRKFFSIEKNYERVKFLFPVIFEHKIDAKWIKYNRDIQSIKNDGKFTYDTKNMPNL